MEGALFLPAFKKLKFVNCNRPIFKELHASRVSECEGAVRSSWGDFEMHLAPFDKKTGRFTMNSPACPSAEFAKQHDLLEVMPALCNPDLHGHGADSRAAGAHHRRVPTAANAITRSAAIATNI